MVPFELLEMAVVYALVDAPHLPVRVQSLPVSSTCCQLSSLPITLPLDSITPETKADEVAYL